MAIFLDTLHLTCGSLNDLQSETVFASMDKGLSEMSVDEIDRQIAPMVDDLYDTIQVDAAAPLDTLPTINLRY